MIKLKSSTPQISQLVKIVPLLNKSTKGEKVFASTLRKSKSHLILITSFKILLQDHFKEMNKSKNSMSLQNLTIDINQL
jgi:hypothetical protein